MNKQAKVMMFMFFILLIGVLYLVSSQTTLPTFPNMPVGQMSNNFVDGLNVSWTHIPTNNLTQKEFILDVSQTSGHNSTRTISPLLYLSDTNFNLTSLNASDLNITAYAYSSTYEYFYNCTLYDGTNATVANADVGQCDATYPRIQWQKLVYNPTMIGSGPEPVSQSMFGSPTLMQHINGDETYVSSINLNQMIVPAYSNTPNAHKFFKIIISNIPIKKRGIIASTGTFSININGTNYWDKTHSSWWTSLSPADGASISDTLPSFTFTVLSDVSSTLSCELQINGNNYGTNGAVSNATSTTIIADKTLPIGNNTWLISCNDSSGNYESIPRILNFGPPLVVSSGSITLSGNHTYSSVDVYSGATINVDSSIGYLNIIGDKYINISGVINGGDFGTSTTQNFENLGPGESPNSASGAGGGGSYGVGGDGGNNANSGGISYGNISNINTYFGSLGGSNIGGSVWGGIGGGIIILNSTKIIVSGNISTSGSKGTSPANSYGGAGGGSGGSILLYGEDINVNNSFLSSSGGQGGGTYVDGTSGGGGGSGGFIKVFYDTLANQSLNINLKGGGISGSGAGGVNGYPGDDGSIFFYQSNTLGFLKVSTTLNSPLDNSILNSSNVLFNWTSSPTNVNLTNTTLDVWYSNGTLANSSFQSLSGTSDITTTKSLTLQDGNYIWNAETCGDGGVACQFATNNRPFSIDTPPKIIINKPNSTEYTNNVTFNFTFDNPIGTLDYCSYNVTDTLLNTIVVDNSINCSNPVEYQTISDGNYILNVFVNETLGNENATSKTFAVSTTPDIHFQNQTLANNTNSTSSYIPVNVSLQETFFKNVTFNFYNTNGTLISYNYTNSTRYINKSFPDGTYNYNVTVWTTTGQTNSTNTRKIFIDTTFPNISISNPYGVYSLINQIPYSITATDNDLSSCHYNITRGASIEITNQELNVSAQPMEGITGVSSSGTTYVFWATCEDIAGNIAVANQSFSTSSGAVVSSGGGGSITVITKKSSDWLMRTSEGGTSFLLNMIPGVSKTKGVKLTNEGNSNVNLKMTCIDVKGTLCNYITFESDNLSLPVTKGIPMYDSITLTIPKDASLGKYSAAITATDGDNNIQVVSMNVDISSGFITKIIVKLTSNFDGTNIPMFLVFLLIFISLGITLGYTMFKNTNGGKAWGFGLSLLLSLMILSFL